MSDYRNPNDPMWQGGEYEPAARSNGSGWGWLAGAVVIVVLIAIVFGAGHGPTRTAMNENRPMAGNLTAPPAPAPVNPAPLELTPPPANSAQTSPAQ